MDALLQNVEGAGRLLTPSRDRYAVTEAADFVELNHATYRVRQAVHLWECVHYSTLPPYANLGVFVDEEDERQVCRCDRSTDELMGEMREWRVRLDGALHVAKSEFRAAEEQPPPDSPTRPPPEPPQMVS